MTHNCIHKRDMVMSRLQSEHQQVRNGCVLHIRPEFDNLISWSNRVLFPPASFVRDSVCVGGEVALFSTSACVNVSDVPNNNHLADHALVSVAFLT
jgi:hypothetical protein